jgi:prenyltransferase beta subunit
MNPGGCTYCAVASLALANELSQLSDRALDWLVHRQTNPNPHLFLPEADSDEEDSDVDDQAMTDAAFKAASMAGQQGRAHKEVDSCYSFWIGAAIKARDVFSRCLARTDGNTEDPEA